MRTVLVLVAVSPAVSMKFSVHKGLLTMDVVFERTRPVTAALRN